LDNLAAQCPGCAATFAPHSGAVHPYIGASAGCWALYCAVLARSEPSAELLTTSPPPEAAYALRHCFPATGGHRVRSIATYVRSVYEAWRAPHQQQLDAWYDAFIAT
jgi:hypothetical protein